MVKPERSRKSLLGLVKFEVSAGCPDTLGAPSTHACEQFPWIRHPGRRDPSLRGSDCNAVSHPCLRHIKTPIGETGLGSSNNLPNFLSCSVLFRDRLRLPPPSLLLASLSR